MLYNNEGYSYTILSHFMLGGMSYTRVKFVEKGIEEVFLTIDAKSGNIKFPVVEEERYEEEKVNDETLKEVEKVAKIKVTNPQKKASFIYENELEEFAVKNKLDIESVKSVLAGEQKTHRKWGFTKVE